MNDTDDRIATAIDLANAYDSDLATVKVTDLKKILREARYGRHIREFFASLVSTLHD